MERRVLVAIFLSFLVLYVYQTLVVKPVPGPAGPGAAGTLTERGTGTVSPAVPSNPRVAEPPPPAASTASALTGDTLERDVRVETRDVIAVFTNRGARLKSWRLKHFSNGESEPLELIVNDLATHPLPFSLRANDDAVTATLNGALYAIAGAPRGDESQSTPTQLTFEYRDTAGIHAIKEFNLSPTSYVLAFRATVRENDRALTPTIQWGPAVGGVGAETSQWIKKAEGLLFANGKVQRFSAKDIAKQATYEGDFPLAGVDDHYFMTAAISPGAVTIRYQPVSIPPPQGSNDEPRDLVAFAIDPGTGGTRLMRFFAGPKDFDVLTSIDRDLVRAIDFGMFAVLVVPLLRSLKWINGFADNYGWSIIILTIIINAIMFPLRHKSVVSMRKMQELQPEMKAIQDRYAKLKTTDPARQKMNKELMALYRDRGVNPASGCVPMLMTMPVLFAFYTLLSTAIELRGAPFFGWIHDLSLYDPLYVTPVLMGITMVWQQKITPATGADPVQQKMMMLMPVVFTFMFLWAPSGVAVYWLTSNLWAIGQQYATNYLIGPPTVRNVRPPAQRQMKRVGGSKTEAATRES